jgi:glutathione synthase/RimK-type ligase-like ATP-grasp enzyme
MLLIITEKADLTSDYLILKLLERKIPFIRLNTEDFTASFSFDFSIQNEQESYLLNKNGKQIPLQEITGAYFRRPALPNLDGKIPPSQIKFAQREMETVLSGYFRLIDEAKWLNHPKYIFLSNNKIEQLAVARKIGLNIPNTLITSNKDAMKHFAEKQKSVIAKAVKHGFYAFDDEVYLAFTQQIDDTYLDQIEKYATIPMILQNRIEKEYDIRINVIGDKVFATAILSQEYPISQLDWRVWDVCEKFDLKHKPVKLPVDIEEKCIAINKHFHLGFSAIDMVLSKMGEYIFLELNPNGQWAWIEENTGYPLRDTIIDYFEVFKK